MTVTIKDIASVAGVSYSTVSKALNDSPLVKKVTKEKIVTLANKMGYEPNFAAQQLVSKKTKIIGLIWPTIERTVLSTLVTNISNEIDKTDYSMILSVDPVPKALETFRKFQVDGIILFEENNNVAISEQNIPLISYGVSSKKKATYPIIDANHEQAMKRAIAYLYRLGHRKITYIGNISPTDPLQMEKYRGFETAIKQHQLFFDNSHVINTNGLNWYDGYTAIKKLININPLPTAIVSGSYDISGGVIRCLRENNISIPKDMSVISYDNIPQMETLEIPLTAIGVSLEELAKEIVEAMIALIDTEQVNPITKKMNPTLVERSSCAYVKN
ncbi:LacI family DNA-binding transcriptional regulator [Paraliobacillus zengyii]|uniref:LacI family DNA-binding transcriptional regulator n=1 Tax=Paraliobacillus zengyii TaxID=2213194 RepID=UPI000DD2E9E8|nr:LacI family DNA-binding transcriptional regulator [Paraliobacillus zengyii]